jgi:hypothetical protein
MPRSKASTTSRPKGLTIRDHSGTSSSNMCYGLAGTTINADYSVTLSAFAYENVRGAAITTSLAAPVREPSTLAFMSLRLAGVSAAARRRKKGLGALRRGPDAGPHWQSLGRA